MQDDQRFAGDGEIFNFLSSLIFLFYSIIISKSFLTTKKFKAGVKDHCLKTVECKVSNDRRYFVQIYGCTHVLTRSVSHTIYVQPFAYILSIKK